MHIILFLIARKAKWSITKRNEIFMQPLIFYEIFYVRGIDFRGLFQIQLDSHIYITCYWLCVQMDQGQGYKEQWF